MSEIGKHLGEFVLLLLLRIYTLDVQLKVFQHNAFTWTKLHPVIVEGMDFDL